MLVYKLFLTEMESKHAYSKYGRFLFPLRIWAAWRVFKSMGKRRALTFTCVVKKADVVEF